MYLRLTRGQFDPAAADQITALASDVTAAVRRMPGMQHIFQAQDRSAGTLVAISIWDTEEHARFTREDLGDVVTRIRDAGVQLAPPEIYEVVE